jgi:hypothetical protein
MVAAEIDITGRDRSGTEGALHHPVVVRTNAQRYADFQLRLADWITAFAGSMRFVYPPCARLRGVDAVFRAEAVRNGLSDRVSRETADAWIAAWEAQAAPDGLEYRWAGWDWIAEQRMRRKLPE